MADNPFIDIAIPLYNEEKRIEASVRKLLRFLQESAFPYRYRLTLTNNASTDGSRRIIEDLAKEFPQIKVINLEKKGKGLAVRTAWSKSDADILAFMDADMSSDLKFLRPLVDGVISGRCDLSIGNRLGPSSKVYSRRVVRKIVSRVYNVMARMFTGTHVADHQCGFKAMRRESFLKILPFAEEDGFLFDTEWIALSSRQGLKVCPVDIIWYDDLDSKVMLVDDSLKVWRSLLKLRRRLARYPRS